MRSATTPGPQLREVAIARSDRRHLWLLALCLTALYLLIRVPWLLTVPGSEAPDEPNHLWVAQFLREHWRLPTAQEVFAAGTPAEYGPLPQFGYIPHVIIGLASPVQIFPSVSRWGTLLAGLPTLWISIVLGRELFGPGRFLAIALPLLVLIHPQLVFTQTYTNSDATVVSLTSAAIYLVVLSIRSGLTAPRIVLTGLLLGLAALSKHTSLALVPPVFAGLTAGAILNGATLPQALLQMIPVALVFATTCGWYYIRNYFEYNGDWLGSQTMDRIWLQILPTDGGQVVRPWPAVSKLAWWRYVFFDFWGLFGYMNRYLWRPLYLLLLALSAAATAGWLQSLKELPAAFQHRSGDVRSTGSREQIKNRFVWLFLASCALLNFAAVICVTLGNVSGPHGRYLFPSELPIMALLLAGLSRLGPRAERVLVSALILVCAAGTISGWSVYYWPR